LSRFGAWPASVRMNATVMAKHAACAAPSRFLGVCEALVAFAAL
jgi:hypothetical protein